MALAHQVLTVTAFSQNCTVLWCTATQRAAVVDPGGDIEEITAFITDHHLKLDKILLTHGHIDHVGGTEQLAEQFNVPVEGPQLADQFWLERLPQQAQMFHFPQQCPPLTPQRWLNEGDSVTVGNETLSVLHCPGHTPGHIVFYSAAAGLLVAGDVLFYRSIGRADFPQSDPQQLLDAIRRKLYVLPDDTLVLPGHGRTTTIGDEKQHNPFVHD